MAHTLRPRFPVDKVPGTFDGAKYPDVRVLLPLPIQAYYKDHKLWDYIVRCKFYMESDVVWFYDAKYKLYRKHLWGYRERVGGSLGRYIKADDWQQEAPK